MDSNALIGRLASENTFGIEPCRARNAEKVNWPGRAIYAVQGSTFNYKEASSKQLSRR